MIESFALSSSADVELTIGRTADMPEGSDEEQGEDEEASYSILFVASPWEMRITN